MIDGLILQLGGIPGGPEVLLILLLAVLLFGANKIPKLARSTGQAMGEFQKGRQQVEEELEEMQGGDDSPAEPNTASEGTTTTRTADSSSESTETNTTSE
ncbi:Sec-independent protein translocase subunit TatA/TatB [Halorhabdus rudnickae]|uniref:Sec-independent protein translocase subunit TatA/TatB n=1 Tax=Halorhabdus rudnickae TaxID=1775544 RepID=UPI001083F330|nr:twin-arginine translocase TatA/TatE family subunit [Halorhabdus rudnickae]